MTAPGLNIHLRHVMDKAIKTLEHEAEFKPWPAEARKRFLLVGDELLRVGLKAFECEKLITGQITIEEFLQK